MPWTQHESAKAVSRADAHGVTSDAMTREDAARMAGRGISPEDIAKEFGVSPQQVRFILAAYRV